MLSIKELNVLVFFKCSDCGQYNAYVAGTVLTLDHDIMSRGAQEEKHRHIVETLQTWACEFAGNVLKNVDRVVDVNLELALQDAGASDFNAQTEAVEAEEELPSARMMPSVKQINAREISDEEMRDFLGIDLNLIDKKWYFDKTFGRVRKNQACG
jgi:hypothetical protein